MQNHPIKLMGARKKEGGIGLDPNSEGIQPSARETDSAAPAYLRTLLLSGGGGERVFPSSEEKERGLT